MGSQPGPAANCGGIGTSAEPPSARQITGVILAGGRGRRMGGVDKGLQPCGGRPLVEWAIDALAPQVGRLMLSANRNRAIYRRYGLPVIADPGRDYQGPLAGIAAALAAASTAWVLIVPCDMPLLPNDLAARLSAAITQEGGEIAIGNDGERNHPLPTLVRASLAASLTRFLASGARKVEQWQAQHRVATADFSDHPDGFTNVNSLWEAEEIGRRLRARSLD